MTGSKFLLCASVSLLTLCSSPAFAQSAAEIIDRARAEARQFNEFKDALEDPDQSVRLAVLEAMLAHENPALRLLAVQAGVGSADAMMRSRALHAQIMSMDQLHVQLAADPEANKEVQEAAREFLNQNSVIVVPIEQKDPAKGTFQQVYASGQVSNQQVLVKGIRSGNTYSITLSLQDDGTLRGLYSERNVSTLATAKLF